MIEIVVLIGLVAAWGGLSPDRVASPARSALRSGASAGFRSGAGSARSAWSAGAPGRADRAARGRARMGGFTLPIGRRRKDTDGNRSGDRPTAPIGRAFNWLTDRVQAGVFGLGRIGLGAVSIGSGAAKDGWSAGREGWRWRTAEHRTARRFGEKSGWGQIGGIIRDTCHRTRDGEPNNLWGRIKDAAHDIPRVIKPRCDGATGCVWCGRETADWALDSGEPVCDACMTRAERESLEPMDVLALTGRERRDSDAYRRFEEENFIPQDSPETSPPSGGGSTDPASTPKETPPVATPTGQLDIPDISALQAVLGQLAAASEIADQMAGHSATSAGLPDAMAFDAGGGVRGALDSLAEVSPDPKVLAAWAEMVHHAKRVVDRRAAELAEGIQDAKGTTDQLTPA